MGTEFMPDPRTWRDRLFDMIAGWQWWATYELATRKGKDPEAAAEKARRAAKNVRVWK